MKKIVSIIIFIFLISLFFVFYKFYYINLGKERGVLQGQGQEKEDKIKKEEAVKDFLDEVEEERERVFQVSDLTQREESLLDVYEKQLEEVSSTTMLSDVLKVYRKKIEVSKNNEEYKKNIIRKIDFLRKLVVNEKLNLEFRIEAIEEMLYVKYDFGLEYYEHIFKGKLFKFYSKDSKNLSEINLLEYAYDNIKKDPVIALKIAGRYVTEILRYRFIDYDKKKYKKNKDKYINKILEYKKYSESFYKDYENNYTNESYDYVYWSLFIAASLNFMDNSLYPNWEESVSFMLDKYILNEEIERTYSYYYFISFTSMFYDFFVTESKIQYKNENRNNYILNHIIFYDNIINNNSVQIINNIFRYEKKYNYNKNIQEFILFQLLEGSISYKQYYDIVNNGDEFIME